MSLLLSSYYERSKFSWLNWCHLDRVRSGGWKKLSFGDSQDEFKSYLCWSPEVSVLTVLICVWGTIILASHSCFEDKQDKVYELLSPTEGSWTQ